jgi:hypothetical protein
MPTHNPDNERIKHRYMHYLREAKRLSEHSDAAAAALSKFEAYTGSRNFKRFHIQQAIGFKRRLSEEVSDRTRAAQRSDHSFHTERPASA